METKRQGESYDEEPYDAGGEERPESGFADIIAEETATPSKFPLTGKTIAVICVCVVIAAALAAAFFYFKPQIFPGQAEDEAAPEEPWGDYEEDIPPPFAYSAEEADLLRSAGYTAGEIEEFEAEEITDIQPLLDKQFEAQRESFLDMYRAFLREAKESGNEQYNYILANTYLGLPPQEFIEEDEKRDYVTYTENADYWKMPLQGWQPTIKLRLANDAVVYMQITPGRYEELEDSGNMNIRYDYIYYKGVKCVANVTETVN